MNPLDENYSYVDPATVSSRELGTRYGLFWGMASIVLGLIVYTLGWSDPANASAASGLISGILSFGIGIAMIVIPIQKARAALGGHITLGKAFMTGFWSVLVYALIAAIWTFIFMSFIAPEISELTRTAMIEAYEAQGMSEDQIDSFGWMIDAFSNPSTLAIFSFFSGLLMWTVIDLIISAVLKKDSPMR